MLYFVFAVGMIGALALVLHKEEPPFQPNPMTTTDIKYKIDRNEYIDKSEAERIPPDQRWSSIKELSETTSIDVINHPSSYAITDPDLVKEIVDSLQNSKYVERTEYPKSEPDVKLYFRKKDGFIMAGRLYVTEGVIVSPEGPIIKITAETVQRIMGKAECCAVS